MDSKGSHKFEINVIGQISHGQFDESDNLFCKYVFHRGTDWKAPNSHDEGISQVSTQSDDGKRKFVWNFPIDVTFESTNPYGWPQIVLSVYGHDSFGRDVIIGYGSARVPVAQGSHKVTVHMFKPVSSSKVQDFLGWLRGTPPEYIDPKRTAKASGREVTRVRSTGRVVLDLQIVTRNMDNYVVRANA